jgi:hypothetical protein
MSRKRATAEVAELVDALASGASGGNPVEVQVLSSAPFILVLRPSWSFEPVGTRGPLELNRPASRMAGASSRNRALLLIFSR